MHSSLGNNKGASCILSSDRSRASHYLMGWHLCHYVAGEINHRERAGAHELAVTVCRIASIARLGTDRRRRDCEADDSDVY